MKAHKKYSGYVTRIIHQTVYIEIDVRDDQDIEQVAHDAAYDSDDWKETDCKYFFDLEETK